MSLPTGSAASSAPSRLWLAGLPVLALAYRTLLRPGGVLAIGDLAFFHLPLRTLFARAASEGIPWWNTALHGGQPILSNPNYAAFYPPTWTALFLPPATAIQVVFVLHVGWAYAGAWRLARHLGCRPTTALFAALGFAAGGFFVSSATLLTLFCGLAWAPWILLWAGRALEPDNDAWRRDAALAGLGVAAQLLAGEPVNCILSAIALGGLAIDNLALHSRAGGRRTTRRLVLAAGLAVLLGGAQLLPTAGRLAHSPRGGGIEPSEATERSMPPVRLLEWAVPHPLGDPMRIDDELFFGQGVHDKGFPYLISIFPGLLVGVLALGSLGRRGMRWRWTWLVMIGGGVFLALGRHNPLYEPVVGLLPVFNQLRYPEKLLLLANAALPFAAACGLESRLHADGEEGGWLDPALVLTLVATAGFAAMTVLLLVRPEAAVWMATTTRVAPLPVAAEAGLIAWTRGEMVASLAIAAACTVLLGAVVRGRARTDRRRMVEIAILAVLSLDLLRAGWNLLPVAPTEELSAAPAVLAAEPSSARLFTDLLYSRDAQIPLRYESPGPLSFRNGIETLEPYVATLWGWSYALHVDYDLMLTEPARSALEAFSDVWESPALARRFAGAWGVGTLALHRPVQEVLMDRFEGREASRMRVEANTEVLPEIRAVPSVWLHSDPGAALEAARADGFRLADRGHWVTDASGATGIESAATGKLAAVVEGSSRVRFETDAGRELYVQIARTWDAGWSCRIDSDDAPVHRTATGQMGVRVPAGRHVVELTYRDPLVPIGLLLTLVGIVGVVWSRRPLR